jgi:hypothetical protein
MKYSSLLKVAIFTLITSVIAQPSQDDGFDDSGFDDSEFDDSITVDIPTAKPTQVNGSLSFESHYNTKNDLKNSMLKLSTNIDIVHSLSNKAKIRANIKAYKDLIFSSSLSEYDSIPEGYESEISIDQLSFEKSISPELDVKVGRQIVTWGVSDLIRVNDLINPTDNRLPGLTDIKDLKLGRFMTKLDYFPSTDSTLSYQLILINENRFSLYPRYGSDFKMSTDLGINTPSNSLSNTGLALAIKKNLDSADVSFYYLNTYLDKPFLKDGSLSYNNKSTRVGVAYNIAKGSFLIKAEANHADNVIFNTDELTTIKKPVSNFLLGVDYNGFTDTNVTYEISKKYVRNFDDILNNPYNNYLTKATTTQALRVSKRLLNNNLELNGMVMAFGKNLKSGGIIKINGVYKYDDNIDINLGYIDYLSSNNNDFADNLKDNDRFFMKINYKF